MEELLERIRAANDADQTSVSDFGPQVLGEPLAGAEYLTAFDGQSRHRLSPQLQAFFGFANGWRHTTIELTWLAVDAFPTVKDESKVARLASRDLSGSDQIANAGTENVALFAVDDPEQPFQRAYFVFGDRVEPEVCDLGSEHVSYASLEEYLEFWARVMGA